MNVKIDLEQIEGISASSVANWNQAYQWGPHTNMGYLTAVPLATVSTIGGGKLFSNTIQSIAANGVTSTTSRTYAVQLNSNGQLVVNVPWTSTDTITQIGVNNSNFSSGNISFAGGQDIQISKNGNSVRIDYIGAGGGSSSSIKLINLTTDNLDDEMYANGFVHKDSSSYTESEAYDQANLVRFAVRRSNGIWANPDNYVREFYGKMGVRFDGIRDYTTQGTILFPEGYDNELNNYWQERMYYLVTYYDTSSDEPQHGWFDWYAVMDFRKNCHVGTSIMCVLGKLIKDSNDKFSIDVDPKYF